MRPPFLRSLALTAVLAAEPALAASPAEPRPFPDAAALRRAEARYAPVDLKVDLSEAPRLRAGGAREGGRGGADHGRALPAPGLEPGTRRSCSSWSRTRARSAARGSWPSSATRGRGTGSTATGPSSRASRRSPRRRTSTRPARRRRRSRGWIADAPARGEGGGDRVLHGAAAPARREARRRPVRARVPGRARARGGAPPRGGVPHRRRRRSGPSSRRGRRRSSATPTASRTRRGCASTPRWSRRWGPTRSTRTAGSTRRRRSRRSWACATTRRPRSSRGSRRSCRGSRTRCPSTRASRTRGSARSPPSAWSTRCSRRATRRRGCRPPPTTCRTTSGSRRTMGSKRVMLKNVQEAKFEKVLVPIARVALAPADRASVAFDPFFTHILMHELVHGLGPHEVEGRRRADGSPSARRSPTTYSAIEEAKADVGGLFALQKLLDEGKLDARMERTLYPTFLASRVPLDPLRPQRGARQGDGAPAQLAPRRRRDHGPARTGRSRSTRRR